MNERIRCAIDEILSKSESLNEKLFVEYINEKEVSEIIGRALPTLRNDRHRRRGIPYVKIGRSVRYALRDVIAFMEDRKIIPENDNSQTR